MICDCCDGSDEWAGYVTCPNTCKEAYAKAYADKIKANAAQAEPIVTTEQRTRILSLLTETRTKRTQPNPSGTTSRLHVLRVLQEGAEEGMDSLIGLGTAFKLDDVAKMLDELDRNGSGKLYIADILSWWEHKIAAHQASRNR